MMKTWKAHDGLELAEVPEAERPRERAQRGSGNDPMPQHPAAATGAQHISMVDVAGTSHDRMHQRQDLASGIGTTNQAGHAHRSRRPSSALRSRTTPRSARDSTPGTVRG